MTFFKKSLPLLIFFSAITLLIYWPILNNAFLSDDYDSLYRIIIEKRIIIKEFLRPLIDLSFYLNYSVSGLNSSSYYIFNLAIHILNAYLVYKVSYSYKIFEPSEQHLFALISTFFFLLYPFHSESIVWLTGRLSSIASLFGLLVLNICLNSKINLGKGVLCIILYFAGLLAYESILLLPFILLILIWKRLSRAEFRFLVISSLLLIIFYLMIRYFLSGAVYGEYGARMFKHDNITDDGLKIFKVLGRTVLPFSENSFLLTLLFVGLVGAFLFLHIKLVKSKVSILISRYSSIALAFLVSMFIPVLFGVSTRTSEGDRLLYFPSVFLCMMLAFYLLFFLKQNKERLLTTSLISIYFGVFSFITVSRWETASDLANNILQKAADAKVKQVVYINIPDEIEGAFVFRNGFSKALELYNIDTNNVRVNNYITRLEYLKLDKQLLPIQKDSAIFLPPETIISVNANDVLKIENTFTQTSVQLNKNNAEIFYWNRLKMVKLF